MAQPKPFNEQLAVAIQHTKEAFWKAHSGGVQVDIEIRVHPSLYDEVVESAKGMDGVFVTACESMALIIGDTPEGRRFGVVEPKE